MKKPPTKSRKASDAKRGKRNVHAKTPKRGRSNLTRLHLPKISKKLKLGKGERKTRISLNTYSDGTHHFRQYRMYLFDRARRYEDWYEALQNLKPHVLKASDDLQDSPQVARLGFPVPVYFHIQVFAKFGGRIRTHYSTNQYDLTWGVEWEKIIEDLLQWRDKYRALVAREQNKDPEDVPASLIGWALYLVTASQPDKVKLRPLWRRPHVKSKILRSPKLKKKATKAVRSVGRRNKASLPKRTAQHKISRRRNLRGKRPTKNLPKRK